MESSRYLLNPALIVNSLGEKGYVVYVPPNPQPIRIPKNLWLTLQSLSDCALSKSAVNTKLCESIVSNSDSEASYDWLFDSGILIESVTTSTSETTRPENIDPASNEVQPRRISTSLDTGESGCICLLTLKINWNYYFAKALINLFRLQLFLVIPMISIVLAYLLFFLCAPAPNSLYMLGLTGSATASLDTISRMIVALLSVNLFSTLTTWLAQSVTGLGDGKILLRFLFGIIPRLGVNTYKGTAYNMTQWTSESKAALICIAQPIISRLFLASTLIILLSSGRIQPGFYGSYYYSNALVIVNISILTSLILLLPFRKSPGYRLMILLTDLPLNTLSRSLKQLIIFSEALYKSIVLRDSKSKEMVSTALHSKKSIALIAFAILFVTLISIKLLIVLLIAIPRISASLPAFFGPSSQFLFSVILLCLFFRFFSDSILSKLLTIKKPRTKDDKLSESRSSHQQDKTTTCESLTYKLQHLKHRRLTIASICLIILLLIPINRTVTGSVAVASERDLTVRAPTDSRITQILQSGPSTKVVPAGTPIIQLQSQQLDYEINQAKIKLDEALLTRSNLTKERDANVSKLTESLSQLALTQNSQQLLKKQLSASNRLVMQGAFPRKLSEDIQLSIYEEEYKERSIRQAIISIRSDIKKLGSTIRTTTNNIQNLESFQKDLQAEKSKLLIVMPFDGLISSPTSGLMWSFVSKGEPVVEFQEAVPNRVKVLIPDHDRSILKVSQKATIRLYSEPNTRIEATVSAIQPSSTMIDDKSYFQATLALKHPLDPQLIQSSGVARITTGQTTLLSIILTSLGRFINVDVWSWTP